MNHVQVAIINCSPLWLQTVRLNVCLTRRALRSLLGVNACDAATGRRFNQTYIQIFFEPNSGLERVIVGVVGVLQFEVLEYRLKNEYGCDLRRSNLNYQQIRWIENEDLDPKTLKLSHDTKWVQDFRGKNLLIFTSEWSIRWVLEDNPELKLAEFSRNDD